MATKIEWTDVTWNPIVGCSPVSEGCRHCYAARHALRLAGHPSEKIRRAYRDTAEMRGAGRHRRAVFTGRVNILEDRLGDPLRWRKPRMVFVNSMSDLFHPDVPFEVVHRVWKIMSLAKEHTFQVLTKRPDRLAEFLNGYAPDPYDGYGVMRAPWARDGMCLQSEFPLPNVWIGTSVEDEDAAAERIPHLLRAPGVVRFLSCEPLLGPVRLDDDWLRCPGGAEYGHGLSRTVVHADGCCQNHPRIHWVIVGGESGPGARPCHADWVRSIVLRCWMAGVPVFVKQFGSHVIERNDIGFGEDTPWSWPVSRDRVEELATGYRGAPVRIHLRDRRGADPSEWPEDLRIRQFPVVRGVVA